MTPVGTIAVILGLMTAYLAAMKAPAYLAAAVAVCIAVVLRTLVARDQARLVEAAGRRGADPWARPRLRDRMLLASSFRHAMGLTCITSMYPQQALRGYSIARGLRLA